jgi:Methyltransferase domain
MPRSLRIWLRLRLEEFRSRARALPRKFLRKAFEFLIEDLDMMEAVGSSASSVKFVHEELKSAAAFKSRLRLYRDVLPPAPFGEQDLFLEFGVFKGDSINRLAELRRDVRWYGFDSFEGLPDAWGKGARKGYFDLKGVAPPVHDNVTLIKGLFEKSLPDFVKQHGQQKIAFLHIDSDIYSAAKTIFDNIGPLLGPGCIIVFDEFFNYRGWENGEYKAFSEYVAKSGCAFEYLAYVSAGTQVALRLTG